MLSLYVSALITLIIALNPVILLESNYNASYESVSIIYNNVFNSFYININIEVYDCNIILNVKSFMINNIDLTNLSLHSNAIILDGCLIKINTSKIGIYGMLHYNDTITVTLETINDTILLLIHVLDSNTTNNIKNDSSITPILIRGNNPDNITNDVLAYYNTNPSPLDYKRVIILFVLVLLSVIALVREYGHR